MTDRLVWALVLLLVFPLFVLTAGAIPQTQSPSAKTELPDQAVGGSSENAGRGDSPGRYEATGRFAESS